MLKKAGLSVTLGPESVTNASQTNTNLGKEFYFHRLSSNQFEGKINEFYEFFGKGFYAIKHLLFVHRK